MKHSAKLILMLSMGILLGMVSCKDDKDDEETTASATETNLTGGDSRSWKTLEVKYNDSIEPIDTCEMDDYITFKKDKSVMSYVGTNLCEPGDKNETGSWALSNGDKTLKLTTPAGQVIEGSLSSVSSDRFTFTIMSGTDKMVTVFGRK